MAHRRSPAQSDRVGCQIAFHLHKTAQIPSFHLVANILQRADAVEEGIFFVGNVSPYISAVEDAYAESHVPQGDREVGRDGRFAYPALSRCDGNDLGDAAVVVFSLGSGRGAAPPSLMTTSTV